MIMGILKDKAINPGKLNPTQQWLRKLSDTSIHTYTIFFYILYYIIFYIIF